MEGVDLNHDSFISKVSNFSEIVPNAATPAPTGNGRGRPRKNILPT